MIPKTDKERIFSEQDQALVLRNTGMSMDQIGEKLGLSKDAVFRRLKGAEKRARLDPILANRLADQGLTDLAGLHSGWLIDKDDAGAGSSLYFYMGPDEEKISFADAMRDILSDIPKLKPIEQLRLETPPANIKDVATWVALADLHVGGDYGDTLLEDDFIKAIDDIVVRLPPASHAVFLELGDVLEANDHKGITPNSGNLLEVKRENHLQNTMTAVSLIRRALYRLLETHETVEAHFIKGNHDPSAYVAVMLALAEHFGDNPRIEITINDAEFRVISWGLCAAFPHHGDTLKWAALKDVFADQFADQWAEAKMHRLIMTAHFHHDRKQDLVGAVAEQFRTIHRPNGWAKSKGLLSRGTLTAMTVHKTQGETGRTTSNITPHFGG